MSDAGNEKQKEKGEKKNTHAKKKQHNSPAAVAPGMTSLPKSLALGNALDSSSRIADALAT